MPSVIETNAFTNSQFRQSDLLKFIQEKGSKTLWRIVTGLDSVTKRGKWPGGKEVRYHLTVDPGALSLGGLNSVNGAFMPADRAYGIQGFMVPKFQTMTMYFDRIMSDLTDSDTKAYLSHMKMEYEQKTMFQKSFSNLQQTMDGTGRVATPVGFGSANTASGASFTLTNPSTLLKVKLSSLDTATGGAPYLMEGMIVSFMYPEYDDNNDGTVDLTNANVNPNIMTLQFVANGNANFYDAFRVVRINQSSNEVFLAPARKSAPEAAAASFACYTTWSADHHVQQGASANMWCPGTGTVTVTAYPGRKLNFAACTSTATITLQHFFNPESLTTGAAATTPTACFMVLTGYLPTGDTAYASGNVDFSAFAGGTYTLAQGARRILGLGWDINVDSANTAYDPTVDVSLINPYLMTGMDTLMFNDTNMVQGIPRYSVQQILPTKKDWNNQPLTFNSLFALIAEHVTRNREKDPNGGEIVQSNLLSMNPLVYTSLLSLSEADRRITDGIGIRGTSCKEINYGTKKFELDQASWMRLDRIIALPKNAIQMYGGTLDPVNVDGQTQFMSINSSARRTNSIESYWSIAGEQCVENLRDTLFGRNYSISIL
jgi:hypothetical protein